jgi:hypothetical protein
MLPVTLLCLALGLVFGFTVTSVWIPGIMVLVCAALTTHMVLTTAGMGSEWADAVYLACWVSTAGNALSIYLPRPVGVVAAVVLALNAGVYCGAVSVLTGAHRELEGLAGVMALVPVRWAAQRNLLLPLKVASSWLIAIAALAAILQFLPVTPGYLPDHVE